MAKHRGVKNRNHHAASAIVVCAVAIPAHDKGVPTWRADDKAADGGEKRLRPS